jgi:hypothetical protein
MLFHIYSIEKKPKSKNQKEKRKKQKHLPHFEAAVDCKQLSFQVAAAAKQPAATQPGPTATFANLQPFATAVGSYCPFKWRQEQTAVRCYFCNVNLTIYFCKIDEKIYKKFCFRLAGPFRFPF